MTKDNVRQLRTKFGVPVAPPALSVEMLPDEMRKAVGYLTQLYGLMVAAGLYSDYNLGVSADMVHMTMRPYGASVDADRHWISFERDRQTHHWIFRFRGIALVKPDLTQLALAAHRHIGTLEKRVLAPLLNTGGEPGIRAVLA